jgi:hypothetical protein
MLSAFAVISYTENAIYVLFAAAGSWLSASASVTWLGADTRKTRRSATPALNAVHRLIGIVRFLFLTKP